MPWQNSKCNIEKHYLKDILPADMAFLRKESMPAGRENDRLKSIQDIKPTTQSVKRRMSVCLITKLTNNEYH